MAVSLIIIFMAALAPTNSQDALLFVENALHQACLKGDGVLVEALIKDATVNGTLTRLVEAQDPVSNWTALFYAAGSKANQTDVGKIAWSLVFNADLHHRDVNDMEAVHVAIVNRQFEVINALLTHESGLANSPCCFDAKKTFSHLAAEYNVAELFEDDLRDHFFDPAELDGHGQNAACYAAINGSQDFAIKMNETGIPLNAGRCRYYGNNVFGSPLQAAAFYRRKGYVELLLKQEGVEIVNNENGSPLHAMALVDSKNDDEIVSILLNKSRGILNSRDSKGLTPFLVAIGSASIDFAKLLRKEGASISARDHRNRTALHLANDFATLEYLSTVPGFFPNLLLDSRTSPDLMTPLHVAVFERKPFEVIAFLLPPSNPADVTDRGYNAAHIAVEVGNLEALKEFLDNEDILQGAFYKHDKEGLTPLLLAVKLGRLEAVQMMLAARRQDVGFIEDVTVPKTGDTAMHLAIEYDQLEIVRTFLVKLKGRLSVKTQNRRGRTILHLLAIRCSSNGLIDLAKRLPESYFSALENVADSFKETPLEIAVKHNCIEMVQVFLENGFNCSITLNRHGSPPLRIAKRLGFDRLVDAMIASGKCSPDQEDACGNQFREMDDKSVEINDLLWIKNGALLKPERCPSTTRREFKCNAGHFLTGSNVLEHDDKSGKWKMQGFCNSLEDIKPACKDGKIAVEELQRQLGQMAADGNTGEVVRLLKLGMIDVNWRDPFSYEEPCAFSIANGTALHRVLACHAVGSNVSDIVRVLLEYGANPNIKETRWDQTPLIIATGRASSLEAVRLLLDHGANVHETNRGPWTALMEAAAKNRVEIAKVLLERGSDLNAKTTTTALILAVSRNNLEMVRFLLDRGADSKKTRSSDGRTAFSIAVENKQNSEIIRLLLNHRGASAKGLYAVSRAGVYIANVFTGADRCPSGTVDVVVANPRSDWTDETLAVHLCVTEAGPNEPKSNFGGMYFTCDLDIHQFDALNPLTNELSCPIGDFKDAAGAIKFRMLSPPGASKWSKNFGCTQTICYDARNFHSGGSGIGGFYQMPGNGKAAGENDTNSVPNPVTGKFGCPEGYDSVWYGSSKAPEDSWLNMKQYFCKRRQ